ncbi:MAG: hypothetical protein AB7O45_02780 [Alphaproteobacteria bacterium]
MSLVLTPASLAEDALRQIGATYWQEAGAEATKLRIALRRLDLVMAELAGTEHLFHLVPIEQRYQLIAEQAEYDIRSTTNPDIWVVRGASIIEGDEERPLDLYRRVEWDAIEDRLTRTGRPEGLYIEQSAASLMRPYPIPDEDYAIVLTGQVTPADVTAGDGNTPHGWPQAWQRFLILATAYDCGAGPVAQLPESELRRIREDRDDARFRLLARNRRENIRRPQFVAYRDF